MKLKPIQNLTILEALKPLRGHKPLTATKVFITNIPSEIDLILLSSNLLYQSKLIFDGISSRTGTLKAEECINKAISILNILDDYRNRYISHKEFKEIKKEFKLNRLYK